MTVRQSRRSCVNRAADAPLEPDLIVKPGLVREMVALIDRRQKYGNASQSDVYSLKDNSFSDDQGDSKGDFELELQYMALDLSPYVSMDKASRIIEDIQRLSPKSAHEPTEQTSFVSQMKYLVLGTIVSLVIAVIVSLLISDELDPDT